MRKEVGVCVLMRDSVTNEVSGTNACPGWTEDDGATVTMGIGNLPQLATAFPGDVTLTVFQPSAIYDPADFVSLAEDIENGLQVLTFNLP